MSVFDGKLKNQTIILTLFLVYVLHFELGIGQFNSLPETIKVVVAV